MKKIELTNEQKKAKELKTAFRLYFEGMPYETFGITPVVDIPIRNLEITDIQFEFLKDSTIMEITVGRPGLLIGKAGRTIDGLEKFFTEREGHPVKIKIIESRLWY